MIRPKTEAEVAILREGGRRLASILDQIKAAVKPGLETETLENLARHLIEAGGDEPAFLGYRPAGARKPYPAALCVSVNDEIVHGLPGREALQAGDVVSLDLGLRHRGLVTDMAVTVPVGKVSPKTMAMIRAAEAGLTAGIEVALPGAKVGDVGAAVEQAVKAAGFKVVRELSGHGVGYDVHEEPFVPNFGRAGTGPVLVPGLVIAIEPMATAGRGEIRVLPDGFTLATTDGALATHAERTIVVTDHGPEILTI